MNADAKRRVALAAITLGAYAACADTPTPEPYNAAADTEKHHAPRSIDTPESFVVPAPTPPRPKARAARNAGARGPASIPPRARPDGDVWHRLAQCESGNTNDRGAAYYGYFQFSAQTWRSMGHDGTADQYPYDVQLAAAQRLQARSGWGQWPACSRKLGLR